MSQMVTERLNYTENVAGQLSLAAEQVQELVSRFVIGEGEFDRVVNTARAARDELQDLLLQQLKSGLNLFDQRYQPIPGTSPAKYHTAYDSHRNNWCSPTMTVW
ncbi:hypothetical protein [Paludibacterium denitrificans]|uniref:hypothetical protein n=1 Tax=Paludibacterium denitrificans TaxID=2675226 RepID=UPI001E5AE9C4|nr:hypothetical protein [Paludibacterium denitrificans]